MSPDNFHSSVSGGRRAGNTGTATASDPRITYYKMFGLATVGSTPVVWVVAGSKDMSGAKAPVSVQIATIRPVATWYK